MSRNSPRRPRHERIDLGAVVVDSVVAKYLSSHDFNGLPITSFPAGGNTRNTTRTIVRLVERGQVTVEFGDRHPNPHIKCFVEEAADVTIKKLRRAGRQHYALYPSRSVLAERVDRAKYTGRPYTLELALGEGQLAVRYFDLAVLESYRNDPRFHYDCNDVGGRFAAHP